MRQVLLTSTLLLLAFGLSACGKTDKKQEEEKPAFVIAEPARDTLQKSKELEKQMQIDAENQRKVIEAQTNQK